MMWEWQKFQQHNFIYIASEIKLNWSDFDTMWGKIGSYICIFMTSFQFKYIWNNLIYLIQLTEFDIQIQNNS